MRVGRAADPRPATPEPPGLASRAPIGTAPEPEADPWEAFQRSRSPQAKERLIRKYMPLVRAVSLRLAADLPNSVDPDDLVSAGTFGLMDAIDRFDPKLGARFETYCSVRVRGSILDELRHLNWLPRAQSRRAARVGVAVTALRGELGRSPTPREIARKTGLKVREVERVANRPNKQQVSLTNSPKTDEDEGMRHIDVIKAQGRHDPADLIQDKERRSLLEREVRGLPKPERQLVMLYYYEGLTMKEIGQVLNVTESRVCQMHAAILSRLQQRLAELSETRTGDR